MKDQELEKFEEALSARRETEKLISRLNEILFSWNEELGFIKTNLSLYNSKSLDQIDDKEELINMGWYHGSARALDKSITTLKEIVDKCENQLSKGR